MVKNLRSNSVTESVHPTMADILRTMVFGGNKWNEELNQALQTVAWAIRSTMSTATHLSLGQIAFNHNMIIQTAITVDWEMIKSRRKELYFVNNSRESNKG